MALELDLNKEIKLDLTKGSGLSLDLTKGQYVNLSKNSLENVTLRAGAGWNTHQEVHHGFLGRKIVTSKDVDLDLCLALRDDEGNLIEKVYFADKATKGVRLDKDDREGTEGYLDIDRMCASTEKDNENVQIILSKVNPRVTQIEIGVCIYNDFTYSDIDNAYVKLVDVTNNKVLCSTKMCNTGGHSQTIHFATLKRTTNGWVFEAIQEYLPYRITGFLARKR